MCKYLTFDLEDWFHILDHPKTAYPDQWIGYPARIEITLDPILELCDRYDVKATFFCLGWVAEQYPHLIKKINMKGHHIGTHGYAHQLVYRQTPEEFRKDLRMSIDILESIVDVSINSYRAPGFSITSRNLWAFDILYEEGIRYDSSVFPALRSHGGMPRLKLTKPFKLITPKGFELEEYPLSVVKFLGFYFPYSGGGYFRLFPMSLLSIFFKSSEYQMTYFHPRDFDVEQPIIPGISGLRYFKSYYGIRRCMSKLELLLRQNKFCSSPLEGLQVAHTRVVNISDVFPPAVVTPS